MYEKIKSHEMKVREDLVRVNWVRGNFKGNVSLL